MCYLNFTCRLQLSGRSHSALYCGNERPVCLRRILQVALISCAAAHLVYTSPADAPRVRVQADMQYLIGGVCIVPLCLDAFPASKLHNLDELYPAVHDYTEEWTQRPDRFQQQHT